jgi:hypothetical protein
MTTNNTVPGFQSHYIRDVSHAAIAERLPAVAAARLEALQERIDELSALYDHASSAWREEHDAQQRATNEHRVLTEPYAATAYGSGQIVSPDDPAAKELQARADRRAAAARKANEKMGALAARLSPLRQLHVRVSRYIDRAGAEIAEIKLPALKLKPKENVAEAIERIRGDLQALLAQLSAARAALLPSAVAKQNSRRQIEELAEQGRPTTWETLEGRTIQWPTTSFRVDTSTAFVASEGTPRLGGLLWAEVPHVQALFTWLNKDALIAAIGKQIDAEADDKAALSPAEKAKRETEILAAILDVEREEAALIDKAGDFELYRPDTDPRAFLSINGPAPRDEI